MTEILKPVNHPEQQNRRDTPDLKEDYIIATLHERLQTAVGEALAIDRGELDPDAELPAATPADFWLQPSAVGKWRQREAAAHALGLVVYPIDAPRRKPAQLRFAWHEAAEVKDWLKEELGALPTEPDREELQQFSHSAALRKDAALRLGAGALWWVAGLTATSNVKGPRSYRFGVREKSYGVVPAGLYLQSPVELAAWLVSAWSEHVTLEDRAWLSDLGYGSFGDVDTAIRTENRRRRDYNEALRGSSQPEPLMEWAFVPANGPTGDETPFKRLNGDVASH